MASKAADSREQEARARVLRAEASLAAAGLGPVRVERCPDPGCPVCARARRAAA